MGIFRQFPYSDFHDMNMDMILRIMREMQDEWEATKTEWASMQDFINNYFANLNVSAEISDKINSMVADGSFNTVVDPVIIEQVVAWLNEHITPTTPIVDATLSISGQAADSKVVGDNFKLRDHYLAIPTNLNDLKYVRTYKGFFNNQTCTTSTNALVIYVDCVPSQHIVINKSVISSRFRVASLEDVPTNGRAVFNYIENDSGNRIDFVTHDNAKYLAIFCWSVNDTESAEDIINSISINTDIYGDINYFNDNAYDKRYAKAIKEGLYNSVSLIEIPLIITGSGNWGSTNINDRHIHIKISEGDIINIVTGDRAVRVAFRTNQNAYYAMEADSIEPSQVLAAKRAYTFEAPAESEYLYIGNYVGGNNLLPYKIEINGIDIVKTPTSDNFETVFFEDFDNDNALDRFNIIESVPTDNTLYTSLFKNVPDLIYLDSGCLNLKVRPLKNGETFDLGVNRRGVARDKISGYVSTQEKFAIRNGRISARIKCSDDIGSGIPWAFWTFSQNDLWPKAVEFDIAELGATFTTRELTVGEHVYPTDSYQEVFWNNTYYSNNGNANKAYYYLIGYSAKTGSHSWDDMVVEFNRGFDITQWHEYSVEFTDKYVIYNVDDIFTFVVDIENTANTSEWALPKDIRFNIKSVETSDPATEAILSIDWLKVETNDITPGKGIYHDDITMYPEQVLYIKPTFSPEAATNQAFTMSSDSDLIELVNSEVTSEIVTHKIRALAVGEAEVTLSTPNGDYTHTFTITIQ